MIPIGGGIFTGHPMMLAARTFMDACKNIEEANVALPNSMVYFPLIGIHFLVYDQAATPQ
jgi:hypothetical protein